MRATPHLSRPWPAKACATGRGAGLRAAVPARPFGAAVRPLEADRLAAGFFALDLVGDVCFVATGVRVPFVAPLRSPREMVPVGSDKGADRCSWTRKGQARGVAFVIVSGENA